MKNYPLPTPQHEEWSDCELGVIIHHTLEIYNPQLPMNKWKCSPKELPASIFTPKKVDTDQWLRAAKAMGAKYAVFVANHVTGFSMWPTEENNYSVKSASYKNGEADLVKEFIESCCRYNIKPGLYYSTGCNGYYGINDNNNLDTSTPKYKEYIKMVEAQLKELWSNYGELFEIWFDGGVIPKEHGGPDVISLINKYQPNAVCFQGPKEHNKNMRWVGNEAGHAPMNCWSTSRYNTCAFGGEYEDDKIGVGNPDGAYWIPAETDMGNRSQDSFGGGWGWKAGEEDKVLSPDYLLNCYYTSVGRNSNLLLGMAINQDGYFEDEKQFIEFGKKIEELYAKPVKTIRGIGTEFEIELETKTLVKNIVLMEDIHYGERVRNYTVQVELESGLVDIFSAKCIGHKRIIKLDKEITKAKLIITDSIDEPIIKEFTLYE